MKLLALDTSTDLMALAVGDAARQWTVLEEGGAKASSALLPRLQALMHQAGLALADLDALAYGAGPGAFTGLRTACAVVQGLAYGLNKPVLALDSLQLVAEDARAGRDDFDVEVAMDARMGEAYAGCYRFTQGAWQVLRPPALLGAAELGALWQANPPPAVAGNAWPNLAPVLALPEGVPLAPGHDRAAALWRCAAQAWATGPRLAAAQALPLYLRDKVAQTTAERLAAKAAASQA